MGFLEVAETNPIRIKIGEFLSTTIFENEYIYLSFWSIVHLLSGSIIFRFLRHFTKNNFHRFMALVGILIAYEVMEFWAYNNISFFIVETYVDVVWDLIFGLLGGVLVWLIEKK